MPGNGCPDPHTAPKALRAIGQPENVRRQASSPGENVKQPIVSTAIALCLIFATKVWPHPGSGIVVDQEGHVYFVLFGGHNRIMKVDAEGMVATFIADDRLRSPHHLVIDLHGNLYTVSDMGDIVWKITPQGRMTEVYPRGIEEEIVRIGFGGDPFTIDQTGNIYFISLPFLTEDGRRTFSPADGALPRTEVLKVTPDGSVTSLAGGERGYADGKGESVKFGDLHAASMAWGPDGLLYVTDGNRIRKVAKDGSVTTLDIRQGPVLKFAFGLEVDREGNVYLADYGGGQILKITPAGTSIRLPKPEKGFFKPSGIAIGPTGNIYVLDDPPGLTRVWRISKAGNVEIFASVDHSEFGSSD